MKQINQLLQKLYPENVEEVTSAVEKCFNGIQPKTNDSKWYKNLQLYVTYADSFNNGVAADFRTLTSQLEQIKDLGCNCIHVLPFLASPMIDMGFDVSDYFLVREELGGGKALDQFLDKAKQLEVKVMMDIVLNHVSEEHRWYRQAVSGDDFYKDFFIWRETKPKFVKQYTDDHGVWAQYQYNNKKVNTRIIFPEHIGELPHWVQAEDGNWYYHTFYPHQLDLNWYNYNVFIAFAKVLVYWAKKGVVFRLDAIPFVSKQIELGLIESNKRVHDIVAALNLIVKQVNQECIFLVEANQPMNTLKEYFGKEHVESELAYNFPLMNSLWTTILMQSENYVWECLDTQGSLPDHADWVTFLRNHDELTLEYATPEHRKLVLKELKGRGKAFREGFGYAGRTYNFLENDEKRTAMAYFLLASLPGKPTIIFGDEHAKEYSNTFMKQQTKWKRVRFADSSIAHDTRDINRSPIVVGEDDATKESNYLVTHLSKVFQKRLQLPVLKLDDLERIESDAGVFAAEYKNNQPFSIFINLTEETKEVEVTGNQLVAVGNPKLHSGRLILPSYSGIWIED